MIQDVSVSVSIFKKIGFLITIFSSILQCQEILSLMTTNMNDMTMRYSYWTIYRHYGDGMCLPLGIILGRMRYVTNTVK